jgi:hypothetical protein
MPVGSCVLVTRQSAFVQTYESSVRSHALQSTPPAPSRGGSGSTTSATGRTRSSPSYGNVGQLT